MTGIAGPKGESTLLNGGSLDDGHGAGFALSVSVHIRSKVGKYCWKTR